MIAVGSDDTNVTAGRVIIYEYSENRRWIKVETLASVTDPVHDVAFAPNLGRSYHLLAIASKDVRIVVLKPLQRDSTTVPSAVPRFETRQLAQFDEHSGTVWRVSWNITGTMLASTGGDGCVRLWKSNYLDVWKCIAVIKGDGSGLQADTALTSSHTNTGGGSSLSIPSGSGAFSAKFYKLGQVTQPDHVPWH
jgi:WD40 repeat protein